MFFLILINTSIFILLSFLHIYWALGGNWGMNAVLPEITEGQKVIKPGIYAKFAIAGILGAFAFITIGNLCLFQLYIPLAFFKDATLIIGILFLLRGIGDFKYVGFFKKATGTLFAKNDTRYYSPLCMMIAVLSFLIVLLEQ